MIYAPAFVVLEACSEIAFLAAERIKTIELVAPGTAPLIKINDFAASTE